ncbi:MAG: hypothetical protein QQW96_05815 [Tychonema bourrellyi B0820]|uniref:hypothetical protein n=1 Tax=Tychonema bourrellyi TaxID=54313 RepID=UPI0015D4AAFA|nr:hypothetical protein [Tychonema bourrellyi]MDQ2097143.1 hypothetical protein [Tychonema bourrellyi B0820]
MGIGHWAWGMGIGHWLLLTSCTIFSNRQDACSTKSKFSCGMGILPVHKMLIDSGSSYQLLQITNNK